MEGEMEMKIEDLNLKDAPIFKEIVLKKFRWDIHRYVGSYMLATMDFDKVMELHLDEMLLQLRAIVLGKENLNTTQVQIEIEYVPLTWWDHFKEDHFPEWMKKLYPVKTREIIIETRNNHIENRICPHIDAPFHMESDLHIRWIENDNVYR